MEDNIHFTNMDNWKGNASGKFGLTFKQICLMHINKCVSNGSVEWHGGYYNEVGNNPVTRTYVQNSRDVFCNSVRMLRALLLGYFDSKIKTSDEKLQDELSKLYNEYLKHKEPKKVKFEYLENKVDCYIRLFEELIMLSKRLNFFEEESSEEEV